MRHSGNYARPSSYVLICLMLSFSFVSFATAQDKVVVIPFFGGEATCTGTLVGTRWCDKGDGTVMDMTTGLVWLKKADWGSGRIWRDNDVCMPPDYNCYEDAHTRTGLLSAGTTGAELSDGSVAGDWRLPTKAELVNIANGTEAVSSNNMRVFTGVQSSVYWSSSTYIDNISRAWGVGMTTGLAFNYDKGTNYYVWPVRGGN